MTAGFRIRPMGARVAADVVAAALGVPVANVSDMMARLSAGGPGLRPMHDGTAMAGPALTVRCRPGDNLMLHKALDIAQPGDVIVCDAGGDTTNALVGELMLVQATYRKLGGLVLNGAVRDSGTIAAQSLPVFARGITHRGPYRDGPGEIGYAIALEGMTVQPGDLVIGDADGVLVIPREEADAILEKAKTKTAAEGAQMARILAGELDCSWIDRLLAERGCDMPER